MPKKKLTRRRGTTVPDARLERRGSKVKGRGLLAMWLVTLLLFGGTAAFFIHDWSTRRHVHIPIAWLAFLLVLLVFAIEGTVRWFRSRRAERRSKD